MSHYLVNASMLDDASTDEQRQALREQLGDARIRHNAETGVLVCQFSVDGEGSDDACLEAAQMLRSALAAIRLAPTILMMGTAATFG
jgi:hypothetical protein